MKMSYWRFAAMIATSAVVMFGLMYLNTYVLEHVFWSQTRAWMALLMAAAMAIIMLAFMLGMYRKRGLNIAIFAGSAVVFALSLWLVRSQATVGDVAYMRAMIPHHSIAIMTSSRAQLTDPRVRKLAAEIVAAQRREIAEMEYLIQSIEAEGEVDATAGAPTPPRTVPADVAIHAVDIPTVDLGELDRAEVARVLGAGPWCTFAYSRRAGPVIAAVPEAGGAARGVVKLNGRLVPLSGRFLDPGAVTAGGFALSGDGIRVAVAPGSGAAADMEDGEAREAIAQLVLEAGLHVGYSGPYACTTES